MRPFIAIVAITVIAATAGTIYIGSTTFDGVVDDHPYEAGLAWDETARKQARLGWKLFIENDRIRQGTNEIVLRFIDRTGSPINGASVEITLSRPSTNEYDRTFRADPSGGGRYRAWITIPLEGRWDVKTKAHRAGESFTSVERVETAGGPRDDAACDIQQVPCSSVLESGVEVTLSIMPRPFKVMEELEVLVTVRKKGLPVDDAALTLDLSMPGMFMGSNGSTLKADGKGAYRGRGVIPRCPSGKRSWKASIEVVHGGHAEQAAFFFEVR